MQSSRNPVQYSVSNHLVTLTSQSAPNYVVSASAGGAILFLAGLDALAGCGGYSTYLTLGCGLAFEAMAANQYGWEQTKNFVTSNGFALFSTVKSQIQTRLGYNQAQDDKAPEYSPEVQKKNM